MKVVELKKTELSPEILKWAKELVSRVESGEISHIYYLLEKPDGAWATGAVGGKSDYLRAIGKLECLKADIIKASEIA